MHLALQRDNPRIARFERTDDVLQEILIRLDQRLYSCTGDVPATAPEFEQWLESCLAMNLRRVLADMGRKHYGRNERGHLENGLADDDSLLRQTSGPEKRRRQRSLVHDLVERLPDEEREIIELRHYPVQLLGSCSLADN